MKVLHLTEDELLPVLNELSEPGPHQQEKSVIDLFEKFRLVFGYVCKLDDSGSPIPFTLDRIRSGVSVLIVHATEDELYSVIKILVEHNVDFDSKPVANLIKQYCEMFGYTHWRSGRTGESGISQNINHESNKE